MLPGRVTVVPSVYIVEFFFFLRANVQLRCAVGWLGSVIKRITKSVEKRKIWSRFIIIFLSWSSFSHTHEQVHARFGLCESHCGELIIVMNSLAFMKTSFGQWYKR